jgi:hypothetical protein
MTIENLIKLVPPPAVPDEPFSGPWEPVEAEIGTSLPEDYKDFVRLYGCGNLMDFIGINVPRCKSPYVRLESEIHAVRGALVSMDEELPYDLWPSSGGLIVFGRTDFGDYLFWLPQGAPADWKVVVWGRGLWNFELFDCGFTDFLAGVATGEILPEDFPEGPYERLFKPYSDWPTRDDAGFD